MYLKFDFFERLSLAFWLFETATIGSCVWIYLNVHGKKLLRVLINIYFNISLNNNKKQLIGNLNIWTYVELIQNIFIEQWSNSHKKKLIFYLSKIKAKPTSEIWN